MHIGQRSCGAAAAIAALALAGCAGAPPAARAQDASFVQGCWVEKDSRDGRINAFLRLLPDGPDAEVYAGQLQFVRGVKPVTAVSIAIARDGAHAWAILDGVRLDFPADPEAAPASKDGSRQIMFSGIANGSPGAILASAPGQDRLTLSLLAGVRRLAFAGERDGCD